MRGFPPGAFDHALDRRLEPGCVGGLPSDLNPATIQVAHEVEPTIHWRVGDAADLPYKDRSFDMAPCQAAPFLFAIRLQPCRR